MGECYPYGKFSLMDTLSCAYSADEHYHVIILNQSDLEEIW